MKITIINGTMRHGSTWHCMDLIREELQKYGETEVTEFFLPKDMPHFCNGCFSCFYHGEDTCPHAASVKPIADAIIGADLVIMTSSVYGLDVSGGMKALIDHLCYMWMPHRPNPNMFQKIGLTISTTAGAGLKHTTKTMKSSLTYWGVKRTFSFKFIASASKWDEVSEKKKAKIEQKAKRMAKKVAKAVENAPKLRKPLFRSILFRAMVGAQKKNDWNLTDRKHWESQGWLAGKRPF